MNASLNTVYMCMCLEWLAKSPHFYGNKKLYTNKGNKHFQLFFSSKNHPEKITIY
jgi:hypothetical protein